MKIAQIICHISYEISCMIYGILPHTRQAMSSQPPTTSHQPPLLLIYSRRRGLRLGGFFPFDSQERVEPLQLPLEEIDLMIRFLDAVAFAGVAEEDRFDSALLQRAVILFGLHDGHSQVALAVCDQERRFDAVDVSHRRPFAISFGGSPRLAAEAVFHQSWNVALAVEAGPIADP